MEDQQPLDTNFDLHYGPICGLKIKKRMHKNGGFNYVLCILKLFRIQKGFLLFKALSKTDCLQMLSVRNKNDREIKYSRIDPGSLYNKSYV